MFLAVALAVLCAEPLPPGAVARLGTARLRHDDAIRDAAFSPDGTRLAVTTDDGRVTVWDAATGRLVGRAEVGKWAGVAFAANGRDVGTFASGVGLRVFDPHSGKVTKTDTGLKIGGAYGVAPGRQPAPVLAPGLRSMAFSVHDGERSKVVVLDPATGREMASLVLRHKGWVSWLSYSADGTRLAVADGESARCTIRVIDPASGRVVFEQLVEGLYPAGVSLSRDGSRVAAPLLLHDGPAKPAVKVWDTTNGKPRLNRPVGGYHFHAATIAPDGKTLAVLEERKVTLVDVASGLPGRVLDTRWRFGRLFFAPDGRRLAAVSNGKAVEVFDTATGRVTPGREETFDPHPDTSHAGGWLQFRPDGKLVARLHDELARSEWDPLTGRRVESISPPPKGRYLHAISPDGRRLIHTTGGYGAVGEFSLWDRERKADVARSTFPSVVGPRFDYSADGKRLFLHPWSYTPSAAEWWELDPETLERVDRVVLNGGPFCRTELWASKFTPDGRRRLELTANSIGYPTGLIRQWDVPAGREGATIRWSTPEALADTNRVGEMRSCRSFAVSGDGHWVAVAQFIGHRGRPREDNRDPVTGGHFLSLFDAADGREFVRFPLRPDKPDEAGTYPIVSLSWDGRLAAVHGVGVGCRVYETASGTERRRVGLRGVTTAVFSPDPRYLVTHGSADAGLVWDLLAPPDAAFSGGYPAAWAALADPQAKAASPATAWLCGRGDEAVRFLAAEVRAVSPPTLEAVTEWVKQLDADEFADREAAEARLRWVVGHHAARFGEELRRALKVSASAEVRRRLERVLAAAADRFELNTEDVRGARVVEALERIGTPAARAAVAKLAAGQPGAWLTRHAILSRDRAAVR